MTGSKTELEERMAEAERMLREMAEALTRTQRMTEEKRKILGQARDRGKTDRASDCESSGGVRCRPTPGRTISQPPSAAGGCLTATGATTRVR
jgi:uncharacterized coiled-coil protein SlyX